MGVATLSFDGNGTFNRLFNWVTDKTNGLNITASRMDSEENGYAAGLSNCITRDGQGKATADQSPASDLGASLGTNALRWLNLNGVAISSIVPIAAAKSASTARSSVITPSNDPDLVIALPSAGTYAFEVYASIWGTGASAQGFRHNINFSAAFSGGTSQSITTFGVNAVCSVSSSPSTGFASLADIGATAIGGQTLSVKGTFIAANPGQLGFSWAQNSSSANAANVGLGSYIRAVRVA